MKTKTLPYLAGVAALGIFLAGSSALCANYPTQVQYYIRTSGDTFMSYVQQAFVKKAKSYNVRVDTYDASNNAEEQFMQFNEDSRSQVPMVVDLVDPSTGVAYIRHADHLNTTIVFINRAPNHDDIINSRNAWYVGSISEEAGEFQANMITDYLRDHPDYDLNSNKVLDIMLLRGPESHDDTINRTTKVLEALDHSGISYKIVFDLTCNWSFESAFAQTVKILRNKEDRLIDMVISNNDDMALGVINAYLEHNSEVKLPPVFGVDAIPDALDAIADGTMTGTIMQDTVRMGETALSIACGEHDYEKLSQLAGAPVDSHFIRIPYQTITRK